MKIGFFDSGLGGLMMLRAVTKQLPQYDYYYYGDTAHVPYGDKTEAEIYEYSVAAMEYLFAQDCALVIVACNTASAETLRKLQQSFLPTYYPDRKILGVIIPTIEYLEDRHYQKVLLIGTSRTVASGKYDIELSNRGSHSIVLHSVPTPTLVPLIEVGEFSAATTEAIHCIDTARGEGEAVVLGCTHYSILKDELRAHYGTSLVIISQDEIIPDKLADYLNRHEEIKSKLSNTGKRQIHLTKHTPQYDYLAAQFLGGAYLAEVG